MYVIIVTARRHDVNLSEMMFEQTKNESNVLSNITLI
jgi:hypothetical protein